MLILFSLFPLSTVKLENVYHCVPTPSGVFGNVNFMEDTTDASHFF